MQTDLTGRVAWITGSSRNLGRAIALKLASSGASVVIHARKSELEAMAVADEVRASGGRAIVLMADIGSADDVRQLTARASAELGPIDILINNAAHRPHTLFLDMAVEEWDGVIQNNLSSAFYCASACAPDMVKQGWGRVINVSGVDGFTGGSWRVHNIACKMGLIGFTRALASELGPHGVTVNAVVPGTFDTERDPALYPDWPPSERRIKRIPVQRMGRPEEVADLCAYLVSDAAAYVTGQAMHINGGSYFG